MLAVIYYLKSMEIVLADGLMQVRGLCPVRASRDVPVRATRHDIFAQWWHGETKGISRKKEAILHQRAATRSHVLKHG